MGHTFQDIKRIHLFEGLEEHQQLELFEISRRQQLPANKIVVKEGEVGVSLYVILEGYVRVSKGIKGELEQVATLGPGEFFGEMALLEKASRSATVTTMEPATLLEFSMGRLQKLFEKEPRLAQKVYYNLAKGLSERLRRFMNRVEELSWRSE